MNVSGGFFMNKMLNRIAAASAVLLMGAFAFGEGYINANDLENGEIVAEAKQEDGFVILGTADKNVTVDTCPAHTADDGEVFTKRIKLNGGGDATFRCISFPVKKGETITVYGNSGSKTDARVLVVVGTAGAVTELSMDPDPSGAKPTIATFKAAADDTYSVYSKKSGLNVYQIKITK
jgi:hypothetical protein